MYIKPCPMCGRKPKISEGKSRNGHRFYSITCPNYCSVLKPELNQHNYLPRAVLYFNDNLDYNSIYKEWNNNLKE